MSSEELVAEIQAGATERMGELWEQVAGLVKWKANHIMTALELRGNLCGVEFEDLYQSGYIAMVETVNSYNPEGGVAFSTCFINRLKTVFADATGYRTKSGRNEPLNNSFSLDKTVDDESDGTPFGDFVPDPQAAATMLSVEDKLWQEQLHKALEAALAALPEKYADVMRLRHYQGLTLADVGEIQGTTAERIRQMENKAIRQLRKPSIACHLRPFYEYDFYLGTGLEAFKHTGMSIQERYLILEENRRELECKRCKEKAEKDRRQLERINREMAEMNERIQQRARDRVARMTPEEKRALLVKYGLLDS